MPKPARFRVQFFGSTIQVLVAGLGIRAVAAYPWLRPPAEALFAGLLIGLAASGTYDVFHETKKKPVLSTEKEPDPPTG